MRILIMALCLVSGMAFADSYTREYEGQVFNLENQAQCEVEYSRITNAVEKIKGVVVLDGGCQLYGDKFVKVNFTYEAPITVSIDRFRHDFRTAEACEMQVAFSSRAINNSGNVFVASYCNGRRYRLDYVDRTYSILRGLNLKASFKRKADCQTEIKTIEKVMNGYGMNSVLTYCQEVKNIQRDGTYFKPVFHYLAVYNKGLEVIEGREVESDCLDQRVAIERAFNDADIRLSHKFCSGYKTQREYLIYLDERASVVPTVKLFKGTMYADMQVCEAKMADVVAKFKQMNRVSVYSYCLKRGKKRFSPQVYYAKMPTQE